MNTITHEPNNPDAWYCVCGNEPHTDGFFTCDTHGEEIEPLTNGKWNGLYVCNRCGVIINQDTLEIVGKK